jgi:hypothetical protein
MLILEKKNSAFVTINGQVNTAPSQSMAIVRQIHYASVFFIIDRFVSVQCIKLDRVVFYLLFVNQVRAQIKEIFAFPLIAMRKNLNVSIGSSF